MQTAKVIDKEFSGTSRALALSAINADDRAGKAKASFYAAIFKEGILPSSLECYAADAQAIARSTFPKKVQDAVSSKLIRKDDIVKGVKAERTGKEMKKVDWQNQINRKARRLLEDYTSYIARHHDKVEVDGTLQPIALDENNRPVRLPKAEKAPEITYLEAAYRAQVHFSGIKSPRTVEVELSKVLTKVCDLLKGLTPETKKRFSELSTGKKTVEVTAKVKAKK